MLDTIREGFERFGFMPIETPVFELTQVLLTKTGGETEKQVYFVQSTGGLKQGHDAELALRFDLTVPLARYVSEHEPKLVFPFKRYQQQRVYRGERNQKGRFREFYQCDIDVIGKDTLPLAYDAEVPAVICEIFERLNIGEFTIRLNNRKLLRGLLDSLGIAVERQAAVLHEVDRLDKLPRPEVEQRLTGENVGLSAELAGTLITALTPQAKGLELLAALQAQVPPSEAFNQGLAELGEVYRGVLAHGVPEKRLAIVPSCVRGLDYYTGTVYETFLDAHPKLGSICSGGRYENLASLYTKSKLPGVGISIGATRLFDQLRELGLTGAARTVTDALVVRLDEQLSQAGRYEALATPLRRAGLNVEVYASTDKLGKQFKYADRIKVPFVVIMGEAEASAHVVKVKDMAAQQETTVPVAELGAYLSQKRRA